MARNVEGKHRRKCRISAIRQFVADHIGRELLAGELKTLDRLNDQDLHLIIAAMDECKE